MGYKLKRANDELIFLIRIVRYNLGIARIKSEFLNINSNLRFLLFYSMVSIDPPLENCHFLPPDRLRPQKNVITVCKHKIGLLNISENLVILINLKRKCLVSCCHLSFLYVYKKKTECDILYTHMNHLRRNLDREKESLCKGQLNTILY